MAIEIQETRKHTTITTWYHFGGGMLRVVFRTFDKPRSRKSNKGYHRTLLYKSKQKTWFFYCISLWHQFDVLLEWFRCASPDIYCTKETIASMDTIGLDSPWRNADEKQLHLWVNQTVRTQFIHNHNNRFNQRMFLKNNIAVAYPIDFHRVTISWQSQHCRPFQQYYLAFLLFAWTSCTWTQLPPCDQHLAFAVWISN